MRGIRRTGVVLLCCLTLVACTRPAGDRAQDRFPALGTLVEITLQDEAENRRQSAFRAARTAFDEAGVTWHGWGDGLLGQANAALRAGDAPLIPDDLQGLLDGAALLERESGGLFNPMVGWLVETWGFHDAERPDLPPPDDTTIAPWLAIAPSLGAFLNGTLSPGDSAPYLRIDLGGVAKGVAVADAVMALRGLGVTNAMVNAGGDIMVIGQAGDRPWRIGVRDPRGVGVFAGIELEDGEAIFTSGDYERGFEVDGIRHHHILDPRTGRPAPGTASMTVVHTDPMRADAATTALFVAGDDWPRVAVAMGITQAMRVTTDGRIEITARLASRIRFERPTTVAEVVDDPAR